MTNYFLGVDTGSTKSHALVSDENGRILGFGEAGPGNWEGVGWGGARRTIGDIMDQALATAGIVPAQLTAAGFGLAGYDWPEDRRPHQELIRSLGITAPFEMVNDAFIGLLAGSSSGYGVAVAAGTSCNCYGRNRQGQIGRVTGASRFGEYAGSGELVWRALQAVAHAWSKRAPSTRLAGAFLAATGATDVTDLLAGLVRERYRLSAESAPLVFAVAAQGDEVALDLLRWAGRELGGLAVGVARQVCLTEEAFELVLSGSFYNGSHLIEDTMAEAVHVVAPQAQLVRLQAPPVVGGVLLAMEQVGLDTAVIRPALIDQAGPGLRPVSLA
jgi:N-acetylglucosamine kinase-like BadF-type ATPase